MAQRKAGRRAAVPARPTAAEVRADPVVLAYLAAVVLAGVQALVLDDTGTILRAGVPFLLALAVAVGVRAGGPRDPETLTRWLRALAGAGVLLAVWLLGAFLGALPTGIGEPGGFYRVKVAVVSPVGDHNTAAGLLLPGIVAAAVLAAGEARWRAGLAATTLGLVATLSRGAALVLLGVGLVGLVVASSRRVKAWLVGAGMVATAGVLALAVVLDASPPPGAEGQGPWGASVLGRVDLAERGLEVGIANPVLGVGLGGFEEAAEGLPPPNDHAHQVFTHAFAEGGVVLLLVSLAVPLVLARRVATLQAGPARDVALLGGLGLVVHAQIEILGGRAGYEVLLALLAGLAASAAATTGAQAGRSP